MSPPKHTAKRELEFDTGSVICMSIAQVHIKPGTTVCVCVSLVQTRPLTGQHNCRKSCQAHFTMDCRCLLCRLITAPHAAMRGTCSNIWSKGKLRVTMSFSLITLNSVVFSVLFLQQHLLLHKLVAAVGRCEHVP